MYKRGDIIIHNWMQHYLIPYAIVERENAMSVTVTVMYKEENFPGTSRVVRNIILTNANILGHLEG